MIALLAGIPAVLIAVVVLVATVGAHRDPGLDRSFQLGHDRAGPTAKTLQDNGVAALEACKEATYGLWDFEKAPTWWNVSMGVKGCNTYLSEGQ